MSDSESLDDASSDLVDPTSSVDPSQEPTELSVDADAESGSEAGDDALEPDNLEDQNVKDQNVGEAVPPSATSSSDLDDDEFEGGIASRKLLFWGVALTISYLLITVADVMWAANRVTTESAPAAVVLGAAQYNGEPSEALRRRLDRAAELYESNRVELVVVTGGGQEADITTEAKSGYDYLRETASVPDEDLRLEVQGSSTYESLAAVERFLEAEGIVEVILVTDPYHARRSQLVAAEVGLDASVYPTEGSLPVDRVISESAAVAAGRVVGFRRLNNYLVG